MLNPIGRQALHGYNLNEPRDWHGRWTTGGGATGGPYRSATPIPFGPVGRRRGLVDPETFWPQAGGLLHGGRLIRVQDGSGRGIGDNQPPEAEEIPAAEPFPSAPRVPQGWDTPGHIVGGLEHPPTRNPVNANGTPWLIVGHDEVKTILALQHRVVPSMVIFVPVDGLGPLLLGSTNTADFPLPSV